jgi:hypothetical protein
VDGGEKEVKVSDPASSGHVEQTHSVFPPLPQFFQGVQKMSITDTDKLRARVATLDKLLGDFDGQLDDLFAKSLPETLLGLDTLQQAKLQVTIPYLVYDLVISGLSLKLAIGCH